MPARRRERPSDQEPRDAWKERVQIGKVMTLLHDMVAGRKKPNASKIRAAEVILDRLLPRLQATELTQVSDLDTLTREEILERIGTLLASDPTLLPELIAINARNAAAAQQTGVSEADAA